jgi:hypothetical protein
MYVYVLYMVATGVDGDLGKSTNAALIKYEVRILDLRIRMTQSQRIVNITVGRFLSEVHAHFPSLFASKRVNPFRDTPHGTTKNGAIGDVNAV